MLVLAAEEQVSLPFYATTTVVLLGLLITWLVGEARGLREELIAEREGSDAAQRLPRISRTSLVAVAAALTAGAITALRVQFRGQVDSWEVIVVWAAIGAGFVGVTFSVMTNVLATDEIVRRDALLRALGIAKKLAPAAAALVCGLLASPLFHTEVRLVGAKFAVYGTCLAGACGLKQRRGPGANFPEVDPRERLRDGDEVLVVCQAEGPSPKGYTNRIWDRLPNGRYVSDAFVDTPNRQGGFSSGLPPCGTRAAGGTAG